MMILKTPCVPVTVVKGEPDGMGGTHDDIVKEGEPFMASIARNNKFYGLLAEKQTGFGEYMVYVKKDLDVSEFDTFKRVDDGQYFKLKDTGEQRTPPFSAIPVKRLYAIMVDAPGG